MARSADPVSSRPLLDKLGVREGMRVGVLGRFDPEFLDRLGERVAPTLGPTDEPDLVFLAADDPLELAVLPELRSRIVPAGAIWVVSRKGREAGLRDVDVIAAGKAHGLVDNKVVSFSATHTALRLVIPRALRAQHGSGTRAETGGPA